MHWNTKHIWSHKNFKRMITPLLVSFVIVGKVWLCIGISFNRHRRLRYHDCTLFGNWCWMLSGARVISENFGRRLLMVSKRNELSRVGEAAFLFRWPIHFQS